MILPIITRNTQVALEGVPKSYREAALGIGATKWYMIRTVLIAKCYARNFNGCDPRNG